MSFFLLFGVFQHFCEQLLLGVHSQHAQVSCNVCYISILKSLSPYKLLRWEHVHYVHF